MQRTSYQQLQPEERMTIASMRQQGSSVRAMARTLGRSAATVSRELARNTCATVGYASAPAQARSTSRREAARPRAKLHVQSVAWRVVLTLLEWTWSPQQISGTLKRMWPHDPTLHVSHETIYTAIYAQPRGELRRQLIACLRHGHSTRMSRKRGTDRRGQIPDMVSIHVRPPEVDDRVMPGHWEGDFIKGAGNQSSVGVLVERTSRLVLLAQMEDATAASALAGFSAKFDSRTLAPELHLRPGQGTRAASRTRHRHRRERVLLRPAQPMATRHLRKHQRIVAPVPAQRHRPLGLQSGRTRCYRRQLEQPAARNSRVPFAIRGLRW